MQAAATGFVGRTALTNRAAANGLYLTSYYVGGLVGALALGQAHLIGQWPLIAAIVLAVLAGLILLARFLGNPGPEVRPLAEQATASSAASGS